MRACVCVCVCVLCVCVVCVFVCVLGSCLWERACVYVCACSIKHGCCRVFDAALFPHHRLLGATRPPRHVLACSYSHRMLA